MDLDSREFELFMIVCNGHVTEDNVNSPDFLGAFSETVARNSSKFPGICALDTDVLVLLRLYCFSKLLEYYSEYPDVGNPPAAIVALLRNRVIGGRDLLYGALDLIVGTGAKISIEGVTETSSSVDVAYGVSGHVFFVVYGDDFSEYDAEILRPVPDSKLMRFRFDKNGIISDLEKFCNGAADFGYLVSETMFLKPFSPDPVTFEVK